MKPRNVPMVPERIRRLPRRGWSWIDRRFTRQAIEFLSHDAIVLYFFFAAVSDRHGLSFYAEGTIASRLKIDVAAVVAAREELVANDLVAYRAPLVQVLSWPEEPAPRRASSPRSIASVLEGCLPGAASGRSAREGRGSFP